jgi:OOP family OmpA-OmpF porin
MAFEGKKAFAVTGHEAAPAPVATPKPTPVIPKPKKVNVKKNKIVIDEKVQFENDKAVILPASHELLDEVVSVIKENPQITKVLVEGHASADGDDKHNLQLSGERAKAVMAYLVAKGIEQTRLEAKGFGETQPIADNATEEGKEKNRRVEFTIEKTDDSKAAKGTTK